MVSLGRDVSIINTEEALCSFYMGIKHISKDPPSSPPIKGGHIPLISTKHKGGRAPND
jgi:hypothetical protein